MKHPRRETRHCLDLARQAIREGRCNGTTDSLRRCFPAWHYRTVNRVAQYLAQATTN